MRRLYRAKNSVLQIFLRLRTLFTCCSRGTPEEDPPEVPPVKTAEVKNTEDLQVTPQENGSTSVTFAETRSSSFSDNYTVNSLLAEGGFAKTVLVTNVTSGLTSVAKIPTRRDDCAIETSKETEALSALSHPNIVRLVDIATDGVCDIVVTEYCPGGTLCHALERHLKTPSRSWGNRIVYYFRQLVSAISFMHENNFVHLDLKSENMVLDAKKRIVKVIDFGLSARTSTVYGRDMNGSQGTPWYVAPEVLDKAQHPYAGGKVDVWALGCVLYELCEGHLPYFEPWINDLLLKHQMTYYLRCCAGGGPALKTVLPGVFSKAQEQALLNVLRGMLDPNPEKRVTIWQVRQVRLPRRRKGEEK
ncbi:uncharacterized protein LOC143029956 [Oratosquilla oratoria]|uniref:uncharacterized protein LOC143029956 n=1 Tax=Oratosquilla oratoria TaxID=337810 RepID=UPI003F757EFD